MAVIKNEDFDAVGAIIRRETIDLDNNTYELWVRGSVVEGPRPLTLEERKRWGPKPLDKVGAIATLLAVTGVVSLQDAANSVGLPQQWLIDEAMAWAAFVEGD